MTEGDEKCRINVEREGELSLPVKYKFLVSQRRSATDQQENDETDQCFKEKEGYSP